MLKIAPLLGFLGTLLVGLAVVPSATVAAEGEPIAIVRLSNGSILIESMWNLSVAIEPAESGESNSQQIDSSVKSSLSNRGRAQVRLIRSAQQKTQSQQKVQSQASPETVRGQFAEYLSGNALSEHVLDRLPNHATATWQPVSDAKKKNSINAVTVRCIDGAVVVDCDGVKIVHLVDAELSATAVAAIKDCDVLIYDGSSSGNAQVVAIADNAKSKALILKSAGDLDSAKPSPHNTFAVSRVTTASDDSMNVITLAESPSKMPEDLAKLMNQKEAACTESQKVFAALTTNQLNFKPSNGSHTPRWNTEHMMGRELHFFSQIFHAIDDSIEVMDLNPKQMPPDYRAKHADWTGNEEARQMERVSAFTRRFAYLLHDLPLDKKAAGSFWTPRKLLLQMDRHYGEHTANVKKKFKLPDWPKK